MNKVRGLLALAVIASSVLTGGGAGAGHGVSAISGTVTGPAAEAVEGICVMAFEWNEEDWDWYYANETRTEADGSYGLDLYPARFIVEFRNCTGDGNYIGEWYDDVQSPYEATVLSIDEGEHREGIDASLDLGGSISGTVTDEVTGDPVSVCVSAESAGEDFYDYRISFPDQDGSYTIRGLRAGAYRVHFGECSFYAEPVPGPVTTLSPPPSYPSAYVSEWYDDEELWENADLVTVVAGLDTPGIDAQLVVGGSISGDVFGDDGNSLDLGCVDVWNAATRRWTASTEAYGGSYLVQGLRAGTYKVQFYDCWEGEWASEWFEDERSFGRADPVVVELGVETSGVDAVLARAPVVDLAVTSLRVEQIPLRAAGTELVPLGTEHDVTLDVANLGTKRSWGGFYKVWVEMVSDGASRVIGEGELDRMDAGSRIRETFAWHSQGSVGDAVVRAQICSYDHERTYRNNEASARAYSVIGGTGIGYSLTERHHFPECYLYDLD